MDPSARTWSSASVVELRLPQCITHSSARAWGYVPLVGFDSFQGLPPEAEQEGWLPGQYHSTISATRKYLQMKGVKADRVRRIEGWFEDTLTQDTASRLGLTKRV